jgi:predicted dinucleotide-binding enzyme
MVSANRLNGDAAAAVKLASSMRMPSEINSRLDVTMTLLLAAAFDDAGAASLMASLLQRAPLDPVDRAGLSTSWLVHKIWRESVSRNARKRHRFGGSESAS